MSRHRSLLPRTGWTGPTVSDILAASGRPNILIRLHRDGSRQRQEVTLAIGPAFRCFDCDGVNFEAKTSDSRYRVSGTIICQGRTVAITLVFDPIFRVVRRAS